MRHTRHQEFEANISDSGGGEEVSIWRCYEKALLKLYQGSMQVHYTHYQEFEANISDSGEEEVSPHEHISCLNQSVYIDR